MPSCGNIEMPSENVQKYNKEFLNERKQNIFCYYWKPVKKPRALLLISHGFTEYSMMFDDLAMEMARRDFFVFAHDHAGHGHSDGDRCYVEDWQHLVDDSLTHIKMIRKEYPNIPFFIFGNSMGGAVSILLSRVKEVQVSGTVLIAPALAPNSETAPFFKIVLAKLLSKFIPKCPLGETDYSLGYQIKSKLEATYKDPLRYKGLVKVRSIVSLLQAAEEIFRNVTEFKVPFCILQGDMDKICHLDGAKKFYEEVTSSDKTLKIYPGSYHALLYESDEIVDDVIDRSVKWLEERV